MIGEALFIGVVASLTASLVFLYVMFKVRPSIHIGPEIADCSDGDKARFAFKLINRRRCQVFEVTAQVLLITPVQAPGGPVNSIREISLLKDSFFEVGRFNRKDADAHYALRFGTAEDLRAIWTSESQYIRVNVVSKHALSGFSGISTMIFHTKGQIRKGKFRFGNSFAIESVE